MAKYEASCEALPSPAPGEDVSEDVKPWDATKLPWARKIHVVIAGFTCTFNCNLGSSIPSGAFEALSRHFDISNSISLTLLNSLYMVGYVIGPLIFGPLSEYIGRRPVLIGTFLGYLAFMLSCSAAPSYPALLAFRLLCGISAAAPTTIISGLYADILDNASQRGTAIAVYMCVTSLGPYLAPVISGYSSETSWRWPFWAAALIAVPGLPIVLTLPETFAPVLQPGKAPGQIQPPNIRKIFLRPATLLFTEPVVLCTSLYLTLAYAIMYLMFQAFPILFEDHYHLSPGAAGLAYMPMIVGVVLSFFLFYAFNRYYDREGKKGSQWAQREVYRRLPIACAASPCMVIALFWFGWTAWDHISPVVPSLGGLFFGVGYQLLFMGMSNYMTDVFREYSASAQAAASCTRSLGAVLLPLGAGPMYDRLGIHWAPSLLGFFALAMGIIPFAFIKYHDSLLAASRTVGSRK